jgi:hypothetical protein
VSAALEHAVEDRLGEIRVVEDAAPSPQRLVGGEDQRPTVQMAVVHDLEQDVRGVGAIAEITHLVNDQDVRVGVRRQHVPQLADPRRARQLVDERRGCGEARASKPFWIAR